MAQNQQPIFQTKPQDHFVQIPINIERDSTTLINQTGNSNRKPNHWPTILLSTILVIVGQTVAKLLENFYYDQINRSEYDESRQNDGVWTQALLQTVGFPLLLLPFIIIAAKKQHNNQPCHQLHYKSLTVIYICIGVVMSVQARLSAMGKLEIPFGVFTLIYTTQLLFTPLFARLVNKIKFNRWVVISSALAIATGALTLSSAFGGEPDEAEENYARGSWAALFAAVCFSLLLCNIQNVFDSYIFKRTETTTARKPSFFASVLEVIVFSSLVATIISAAGLLIAGEQDDLKREMNEFSKGKGAYVMAMVGQAVSWQVYWVGIVGLVFSVSSVLSNVISVVTWPIVSVLVVIFFNFMDDEFDVFKGIALITAVLSAAAYFFRLHKENRDSDVIAN
ncbi:purine permease 14 [Raphanus sativus]|uniref:Probable purine permease n=1 Tax=Raphanus sativus TaxID=3726 RepID=A0A6J0KRH0_RAPSA|nr:purine permease 14 [Raphanus sativus]